MTNFGSAAESAGPPAVDQETGRIPFLLPNDIEMAVIKKSWIVLACCWTGWLLMQTGCRESPPVPPAGTDHRPVPAADTPFLRRYVGTGEQGRPWEMVLWSWADGYVSGRWNDGTETFALDGILHADLGTDMVAYRGWQEVAALQASLAEPNRLSGRYQAREGGPVVRFRLQEPAPAVGRTDLSGIWYLRDAGGEGTLLTGDFAADSLDFALTLSREGHNGYLEGRAARAGEAAVFETSAFDDQPCRIVFQLQAGNRMELRQDGSNFSCGFGAGASAQGTYFRTSAPPSFPLGVGDSERDIFAEPASRDHFIRLVGDSLLPFFTASLKVVDQRQTRGDTTFLSGYAPGLQGLREAALVQTANHRMWAATLVETADGDIHLLFLSNQATSLAEIPESLLNWAERFTGMPQTFIYRPDPYH